MGSRVKLIDSIVPSVGQLERLLYEKKMLRMPSARKGSLKIYLSDRPRNFVKVGEKFLGEKMGSVEVVRQK